MYVQQEGSCTSQRAYGVVSRAYLSTKTSSPSTCILINLLSAAATTSRLLPKRQALPTTQRPLLVVVAGPLFRPPRPHVAEAIFAVYRPKP